MSDKTIWYTPRDPGTRSFRWRSNRDRAAAQEAAERQHPDFTVPDDDMRDIWALIKLILRRLLLVIGLSVLAGLVAVATFWVTFLFMFGLL